MSDAIAQDWAQVTGPGGLDLLRRYLDGDQTAAPELTAIFEAADAGRYDAEYAGDPDPEKIHVTTSCHLMVMALLNRLTGLDAEDFYKGDALRYVRTNCLIQRMLGLERLTLGGPAYGFGAELLGQVMIYPRDQAPGSDPEVPLLDFDSWRDMPAYDPDHPVARVIRENLQHMARLGGIEPVAHMPAPYSLAAEIFGQEPLIGALALEPDFVHEFLDLIVTRVLVPWCEDLVANVPDVWLEFSDASGSPMFVGPENFLKFVVDPVRRIIVENPWGDRVFVANYRGDLPAGAPSRGRRKKSPAAVSSISFDSLLQAKKLCCPHFLMRLEADAAPLQDYIRAATDLGMPLYLGIGAVRLDRNSVPDLAAAGIELRQVAKERAGVIRQISDVLRGQERPRPVLSWPGDIYIEDTNVETSIDLMQQVLAGVSDIR
ncbi:hypothetical protein [Candidatus Halocynthiibacter alkanivorans]|uniref:hypothetical protein n=1 Tax=Candidatus Halocynthiibacter alkanivorans TaxID=2267619 RepID=UPI000DF16F1B|nr:hypothetical protein [Candidatus Halocynthiibacter alkanivorans]